MVNMMKGTNAVTDMLTKFDDSKRAVANLMARENITVQVVDGQDTAMFNPKTRTLIVPNWTGLTVEQCDLLMSHEVGHALFTDRSIDLSSLTPGLFSYLNIIEDARIERRMKGAFPGLAPTFFKGYREFHTNGPILKGTKDAMVNPKSGALVAVASMKLIDRINLHYKIGAFVAVPFTATEKAWLARIDKSTSTAECLQIARELYTAEKEQKNQSKPNPSAKPEPSQKQKPQPKQEQTDEADNQDGDDQEASEGESQDGDSKDGDDQDGKGESEDGDSEGDQDGDEDGDDSEGEESDEEGDGGNSAEGDSEASDEDGDDSDSEGNADAQEAGSDGGSDRGTDSAKKPGEVDPTAMTDTAEGLKSIASKGGSSDLRHLIYPILTDAVMKDRVVSAKEFADRAYATFAKYAANMADLDSLEAAWNDKYLATAKHMALEFERKKNAKCLAAAKTAKSGKLDLTKLSQYRWTEDLFKRSMTVPNGKSHGVVMMIDGSGSMCSQFAEVIDQTLLFAQFAFAVNIPFEAYMFSDCQDTLPSGATVGSFTMQSQGLNALTLGESGRLIGLINTTTDRASFKKQVRTLLAVRATYRRDVTLSQNTEDAIRDIPNSHLGGTPLFTGMMIAERLIARMKTSQKLDKTTFIVITDGEDTNHVWYETNSTNVDPYYSSYRRRNRANFDCLYSWPFVIRDTVTKKNLTFVETARYGAMTMPANAVLTMLLDVIKLRHDTRTVYIYMQVSNVYSRNAGTQGFAYLVRAGKQTEANQIAETTITSSLTTDGQYVLPAAVGCADLAMILPVGSVTLTEDAFSKLNTDEMTQKKIAAEFTKSMVKAVANRKFVNSVVPHLA